MTVPTQPRATTSTTLTLTHRLRRLRRSPAMRDMVRETRLTSEMLVYPLFVCPGSGIRREVSSMPGVFQLSVDEAVREAEAAAEEGVRGVLLFGLPDDKDETGSAASDPDAPVQAAVRAIKTQVPDVLVITDVCLCEYTSHGHCGIVDGDEIVNDATVTLLAQAALSQRSARRSITVGSPTRSSCPMRRSTAPPTTARFVTRPIRHQRSAIGEPIRWTRPTSRKRSGRWPSTWRRVPTSSW